MELPLQLTFRHMDPSDAVAASVREHARKLDRFHSHIMSCRVVVESPHHHHRKGNLFNVRLDVTVPGAELAAGREPDPDHAYEDVYVAVRDAFEAMERQLDQWVALRKNE